MSSKMKTDSEAIIKRQLIEAKKRGLERLDIDTFLAMAGNVDACPPCLHQEHRTQFTPLFSKWGNG